MPRPRTCALLAAAIAASVPPSRLMATTYTWSGPYTGSGTANPWSNPSSWVGNQTPISSTATQLVFTNFDTNTYAATNNLSSPSFLLNNLTIENWSQGGTVTVNSLNSSSGTYQLQMAGASPVISLSGPAGVTVGTLSGGTGYGLFLNPSSGATTISDAGNALVSIGSSSAGINGSGGLTINNTGLATIQIFSPSSGSIDSYTGGVNLASGSLSVSSSLSLGASSNVLTFNGGNLRGGSATFANPISAASDAIIFSGSPTIQGVISGNGGLHLYNGVAFSSANVTLSNTETYAGATTIDSGPLRTSTSNLGFLTISPTADLQNTSSISVGQSGTLTFTAGATNSAIPSTAPLALSGAYFSVLGKSTTTSESLGNVSGTGMTTLSYTSVSATATNTLNFGSFMQNDHATLFLRGNWQGTSVTSSTVGIANFSSGITTVADANAPGGYSPVVPYAVGSLTSATSTAFNAFVTNGTGGLSLIPVAGSGVTQYTALSGGFSGLPANDVYLNINTTGTVSMSGNTQVYALATSPGGISTVTIGGTGTLNIASGVMVVSGTTQLSGPTINFGANTGYIHAGYNGTSLSVYDTASPITGSNGLVISGPAGTAVTESVQFSDTGTSTDSSNPFTGGLTVNGGVNVAYTNDLQLGASGQSITLNGGELDYNPTGTSSITLSRPLRLGPAGGGAYTINSNLMTISSQISGPGAFYLSSGSVGTGVTALTNASNNYSGGTYIYTGTLNIGADGDLGAAGTPVVLAGGTLQFAASTTLNRPVPIWAAGSSIDTNGFSPSIAGAFSSVSATAGFIKAGSGTLSLTAPNPLLSGALTVSAGTLALSGNGTIPQVPNVTVASGATFQFDNSSTNLSNRYSALGRVTLAGGTLDLQGNSSAASSQAIGGLNLPGTASVSNSSVSVEPASATLIASGTVAGGSAYAQVIASATNPISTYTPTSVTAPPQSLTKIGPGTLVFGGANTLAGGVVVSAGNLKTTNTSSLGFGAVVPPTLGSEATIGSTAVSSAATLDLSGTSVTEPVTLNGGTLINSSTTAASITSGIKGISFNSTTTSVNYVGASGQTIGSSGVGYVPGDTITYTGGSGASASVILGLTSASFNVSYGGNYTQAASGPNVSISSSNGVGSGATAVPITDSNNDITGIDVTNPGYGYTGAPIITITATGTYTPAVVIGTTTGFGVVGIQETSAGDGYSSSSTPAVNSANGSGLQLNSPVVSSLVLQSSSNIGGTGDIAVSAIVSGSGGLTKIGSDTVTLSSINTYSGGTNISAGTLAVPNPSGLGTNSVQLSGGTLGLTAPETISNSLTATTGVSGISVVVAAGATAANLSGGLTVQSGATVKLIATGSVSKPRAAFIIPSFSDSGTLDIQNNAVDLPGASIGTLSPLVGQGFNGGGGNWHGIGITSSTAANDSTHLTAVGVIVNDNGSGTPLYGSGGTISSTFDGATASDGDIFVKYTYFGDANLDGVVNGSDYSRIDNGYLQHLTGWYNGDFNYDNVINGSDYTLIDNAFNTQGASLAASIAAPAAFATSQIAGPASSVPEPTVLGLLGLATLGLLGRRPRR